MRVYLLATSLVSTNSIDSSNGDNDNFHGIFLLLETLFMKWRFPLYFSFHILSFLLLKIFFYGSFHNSFCVTAQWLLPKRKNKIWWAASLVLNTVTSEFDRKPASVMLNDVFRGEKWGVGKLTKARFDTRAHVNIDHIDLSLSICVCVFVCVWSLSSPCFVRLGL